MPAVSRVSHRNHAFHVRMHPKSAAKIPDQIFPMQRQRAGCMLSTGRSPVGQQCTRDGNGGSQSIGLDSNKNSRHQKITQAAEHHAQAVEVKDPHCATLQLHM